MKRMRYQTALTSIKGSTPLDARFGHLIADEAWIMLNVEVQRYALDLAGSLFGPLHYDLRRTTTQENSKVEP